MNKPILPSIPTSTDFQQILGLIADDQAQRNTPILNLLEEARKDYYRAVDAIYAPTASFLEVHRLTEQSVQKALRAILWKCAGRANDVPRDILASAIRILGTVTLSVDTQLWDRPCENRLHADLLLSQADQLLTQARRLITGRNK